MGWALPMKSSSAHEKVWFSTASHEWWVRSSSRHRAQRSTRHFHGTTMLDSNHSAKHGCKLKFKAQQFLQGEAWCTVTNVQGITGCTLCNSIVVCRDRLIKHKVTRKHELKAMTYTRPHMHGHKYTLPQRKLASTIGGCRSSRLFQDLTQHPAQRPRYHATRAQATSSPLRDCCQPNPYS